jgi:hypothetical protein
MLKQKINVKNVRNLAAKISCNLIDLMPRRFCGALYDPWLDELSILFADTDTMGDDRAFRKFCSRQPLSLSKKFLAGQAMLVFDQQRHEVFAVRASHLSLKSAQRSVRALEGRYAR